MAALAQGNAVNTGIGIGARGGWPGVGQKKTLDDWHLL
jgi:hypothetical protein